MDAEPELLLVNTEIVERQPHSVVFLVVLHTAALEANYAYLACMN